MDLKKKLEEIEEHFKNISDEELEANLKKAGLGVIEPCSKKGDEMEDKSGLPTRFEVIEAYNELIKEVEGLKIELDHMDKVAFEQQEKIDELEEENASLRYTVKKLIQVREEKNEQSY